MRAILVVWILFLSLPVLFADEDLGKLILSAATKGDTEQVKDLIIRGADVNVKSPDGMTPLMCAIVRGNEAIAKLLISKGVDLNVTETKYGQTALMLAAGAGKTEIARALLEKGADPSLKDPTHSQTAQQIAAAKGYTDIVALFRKAEAGVVLQEGGPKQSQQSMNNELFIAAERGDLAAVKAAVAKGADVTAKSNAGRTPASLAARKGHLEVVEFLKGETAAKKERDEQLEAQGEGEAASTESTTPPTDGSSSSGEAAAPPPEATSEGSSSGSSSP
jgi:uncharacterized protein